MHHCAMDHVRSLFVNGFSKLQRDLLLTVPSIAKQLGIWPDDSDVNAASAEALSLNLGHRFARGLQFSIPHSILDPHLPSSLLSAACDTAIQQLNLPAISVDLLKQGLFRCLLSENSSEPVIRAGRIDLWSKLWCRATSSVPAGSQLGGWISILGCIGGEGVCIDAVASQRKRTFAKIKCIASVPGFPPVLLIQLARFDVDASDSTICGYKAHRFVLLDRFDAVVIRDADIIRGEVLVHDCKLAAITMGAAGCAGDPQPMSAPVFHSRRRGIRQPVANVRHCGLEVYMRFDVISSSNKK